jgi:copper transport protein
MPLLSRPRPARRHVAGSLVRGVAAAALGLFVAVALPGGAASAHNSFVSSDPADGDTLDAAPFEISIVFENAVPLDTASATVIDDSGTRTEINTLRHGASGDTEIIVDLPPLGPGEVTVRWRLVSSDGHVISERIEFTVAGASPDTAAPVTTEPATTGGASDTTSPPIVSDPTDRADGRDGSSTPDPLRWLLRYASYLAILAVIGIAVSASAIWPGAGSDPQLRLISSAALAATAVLGFVQLLVIASDITGEGLLGAWGGIDDALRTDAGVGLAVRVVLAGATWLLLHQMTLSQQSVREAALGLVGVLLLGTWAWAGHSRSQRWPEVGVVADVVHHGAAATWIGGLAVVGLVAAQRLAPTELVPVVGRLSATATAAVVALVATGAVQSVRLAGGIGGLLDGRHGVLILVKVAIVAVMLVLARANRARVATLSDESGPSAATLGALRRAIVVEVALGLVALAATASLVVAVPATA